MTKKIEMPVPRDPLMKKILWVVLFLCVVGAVILYLWRLATWRPKG